MDIVEFSVTINQVESATADLALVFQSDVMVDLALAGAPTISALLQYDLEC